MIFLKKRGDTYFLLAHKYNQKYFKTNLVLEKIVSLLLNHSNVVTLNKNQVYVVGTKRIFVCHKINVKTC